MRFGVSTERKRGLNDFSRVLLLPEGGQGEPKFQQYLPIARVRLKRLPVTGGGSVEPPLPAHH